MFDRTAAVLFTAAIMGLSSSPGPAFADNAMGYQLLSAEQASALPRNGGKLGMQVGPAERINSSGLTFELLRVNGVSRGSPGAQAGFKTGDQIIAVDGKVFPSVPAFASYIGSISPSQRITVDYLPSNAGPQEAERVGVTLGGGGQQNGQAAVTQAPALSTGSKVAIGVAAAALFGCYKIGCFSHKTVPAVARPQPTSTN